MARRRAALRARRAGHAALRRLADPARRRRPLRRQAAGVLLAAWRPRWRSPGRRGSGSCCRRCSRASASSLLVYDLLRRVRGREVAFAGALLLLLTFQFVWQARQAQIDATLLLPHDAEPVRAAASPVRRARDRLVLRRLGRGRVRRDHEGRRLPAAAARWCRSRSSRARGWPATGAARDHRWWLGPVFFLGAIGTWFVPMMLVDLGRRRTARVPQRDPVPPDRDALCRRLAPPRAGLVLLHERHPGAVAAADRAACRGCGRAGGSALGAQRRRATRSSPCCSRGSCSCCCSSRRVRGKRGVYVLPALPALAMAAAPWLPELLREVGHAPARVRARGGRWRRRRRSARVISLFAAEATARAVDATTAWRRRCRSALAALRRAGGARASSACATAGSRTARRSPACS